MERKAELDRIKEQIEAAKLELESAQRRQDYAKMSEIQYGTLPALEKQLAQLKSKAAAKVEAGATLDLKATAPATLQSSAITAVKGSMVQIN